MTQGLAGEAAMKRRTINVEDAYDTAAFDRGFDQKSGFRTCILKRDEKMTF